MELLNIMFPIGSVYAFIHNSEKKLNVQIRKNVKKLNNMIGKWRYIGRSNGYLYFAREK